MAIANRTIPRSLIVIYTRRELIDQAPYPISDPKRLESALGKLIDSMCQEIEAGHLGRNQVVSVSTTSHSLQDDVEFVVTAVYRPL